MRVGLIIYGSLDTLSGGYLYDRRLVEHLRRAGDEVEIISLPWRSYPHHLTDNFSDALFRRLQSARIDGLIQDELNHPSLAWLNRRLRRVARYPILALVHHLRSSERWPAGLRVIYRFVERAYLRTVDGFIFNSQTTRAAVEALSGPAARAVVAYPGGDRFQRLPSPAQITARVQQIGPRQLLFVGNLIPRKGLHFLVAALTRLRTRNWHLHVVGRLEVEPAYTREVRRQIEAGSLSGQVTLHGPLPDDDLRERYEQSHLLVAPSSYEGFGIVYLEGMGFGLPAVATTAGAASEIISAGENGGLAPPDDVDALASLLARLIDDRDHLLALSLAARQRYLRHPTWEASMARVREFCGQVFSLKPPAVQSTQRPGPERA